MSSQDRRLRLSRRVALATPLALAALSTDSRGLAQSEEWPQRRVRLIAPAAPGSSLDLVARILAERLAIRWQHPVVVDGRPGADGIPALEAMITSQPGEALLVANHGVVTVTPILHPRLSFDPLLETVPILDVTADQFGVAVRSMLEVRSLSDLVLAAKSRPGVLTYTTPPGPPYLAMRAFMRDVGIDLLFVGFRGVGAATVSEMIAGRLDVLFAPLTPIVGAAQDRRVRIIAVTSESRSPALLAVPTAVESGFPAFRQEGIHGVFGWKGMATPLRNRLAADIRLVIADIISANRLGATGLLVRPTGTPDAFAAMLWEQRRHWAGLAQEFGTNQPR